MHVYYISLRGDRTAQNIYEGPMVYYNFAIAHYLDSVFILSSHSLRAWLLGGFYKFSQLEVKCTSYVHARLEIQQKNAPKH
jgi:hypothetical protein